MQTAVQGPLRGLAYHNFGVHVYPGKPHEPQSMLGTGLVLILDPCRLGLADMLTVAQTSA